MRYSQTSIDLNDAVTNIREAVVVQTALQRSVAQRSSECRPESSQQISTKPARTLWQRFLDDLCSLCQMEKAGVDVVAVGAQASDSCGRIVFWLARNIDLKNHDESSSAMERAQNEVKLHFEWLLCELSRSPESSEKWDSSAMPKGKAHRISSRSIERSKLRVYNYRRLLQKSLAELRNINTRRGSVDDIQLFAAVDEVLKPAKKHVELCRRAYEFRRLDVERRLKEKIRTKENAEWEHMHHLIGRLGLWHRAAYFLVENASQLENMLENAKVRMVPLSEPAIGTGLEMLQIQESQDFVSRVCSRSTLQEYVERLAPRLNEVQAIVSTALTGMHLDGRVMHAETMVASYFHFHGLRHVSDNPYIGCSKPSCFACKIYLESSEFALKARPSSGHAFTSWMPPVTSRASDAAAERAMLSVLESVAQRLTDEVVLNIWNDRIGRGRRHDSTTGITTTNRDT